MKKFFFKRIWVFIFLLNISQSFQIDSWSSLRDCIEYYPNFPRGIVLPSYNSTPALKHEFPHAAAIGWTYNPLIGQVTWACGGSLITYNMVLTAAHCTFNRYGIK